MINPVDGHEYLSAGDLTFDRSAWKFYGPEGEIKPNHRQGQLIIYLMAHAGRVVTRSQIFKHVWELDAIAMGFLHERTIDVHVNKVRKTINSKGHDYIETVRGVGYRFKPRGEQLVMVPLAQDEIDDLLRGLRLVSIGAELYDKLSAYRKPSNG